MKVNNFKFSDNLFYLIIFCLILLEFLVLNFSLENYSEIPCEEFITGFNDTFSALNYIEKNPYSIYGSKTYLEMDISSNLKSLNCIGEKVKFVSGANNNLEYIVTSTKLYKFLMFCFLTFLFILFKVFNNNSELLYMSIVLIQYLVMSYIFFGSIEFQILNILFLSSILIFKFLNTKRITNKEKALDLFLFINVFCLIVNYDIYSKLLLIFFLIFYFFFKDTDLDNGQILIITFGPILYFFLRQISGPIQSLNLLWENLSAGMFKGSPRFADMFYFFNTLRCNTFNCGVKNNYGPITEFLSVGFEIQSITYVTSLLAILATQIFYLKLIKNNKKKYLLIYFVYISPPISFLLERMNFDLIVIIFGFMSLHYYKKKYKLTSLLLISILTLIKGYPILFYFSIYIYESNNRQRFLKNISVILLLLHSIIYGFYFALGYPTGEIATPFGISWTFGMLADYSNFKMYFGTYYLVVFIISWVFSIVLFKKYLLKSLSKHFFDSNDELIETSFLIQFMLLAFLYHFDFRISLFAISFLFIIKNYSLAKFELISFIFLLTSVSGFFDIQDINNNFINFIFNLLPILLNYFTFNLLILSLLFMVSRYLKNANVIKSNIVKKSGS